MLFLLSLLGTLLGGGTITLVLWELDLATPMAGLNLEVFAVWFAFLALVAFYHTAWVWIRRFLTLGMIPLIAVMSMVLLLWRGEMLQEQLTGFVGAAWLVILGGYMVIWIASSVHEPQAKGEAVQNAAPVPQSA